MFEPIIQEIFTQEQCQEIISAFDSSALVPDDFGYSPNSFGIANLPAANKHSLLLTEKMFEAFRNPGSESRIRFKNSYTRKYLYGSELKLHVDRPGLDITLSVCLEIPENFHWPLKVSNVKWLEGDWNDTLSDYSSWTNDYTGYDLQVGQGAFALGRKYPHWRDPFPGQEDQRAVYVFYHWEAI